MADATKKEESVKAPVKEPVEEPVAGFEYTGPKVVQPNNEPNKDGYVGVDPVPVRSSSVDRP